MIKAGAKGSGVNDVVWVGDVVNEAAHLCHKGNRDGRKPVQVSTTVYINLTEEYQKLISSVGLKNLLEPENYQTDIFNVGMREYFDKEKKKAETLSSLLASVLYPTHPTGGAGMGLLNLGMVPPKYK